MSKKKFKPTVSAAPRMIFSWRPNARIQGASKVDAQSVGETLERIRKAASDDLRPAAVVEEARDGSSPLHPLFDWDNSSAADKYRIHQARQVIAAVIVHRVDNRELQKPIPAFVNIVDDDGQRYVSTVSAMNDAEKREIILRNARDDLIKWRKKYEALQEFGELFAVIDRVAEAALVAA